MSKAPKIKIRTQPAMVMEAEVARKIRQHARSSMKAEVCGVLIGSIDEERMVVEACIAGINAAQGGAHVTFTQDTWEHIYKIKDKEYPDARIVGWYHSHPGFGVFLSEHDLFIQQNFFSDPQQVAWVYDPHTDEEGCFGWIGGKIEKLPGIRMGYSQSVEATSTDTGEYDEDDETGLESQVKVRRSGESQEPAWVRWTSRIVGYVAIFVLGFVFAYWYIGRQLGPELEKAAKFDQLMRLMRQYQQDPESMTPGLAPPAGAPGVSNSQQPWQQQKTPDKGSAGKGSNGKH
jgi:proteasome lid subunit RPN8/RPN11